MPTVAVIGTCDTKLKELLFLQNHIRDNHHVDTILIDVGRHASTHRAIGVSQHELLTKYGNNKDIEDLSRGAFTDFIGGCATQAVRHLQAAGAIDGIVAAGGSGGTSIASAVMRDSLPIGFPKLIVSTIASGDTGPIVGETDIMLMPSVVDVAGLNHLLQEVLNNAAASIAAAAASYSQRRKIQAERQAVTNKTRIGITMFGVTTPGVDAIRSYLEAKYPVETYVFHATGNGGRAMERLIKDGQLDAVLDLTTTEVCDFIMHGVMSAGPDRLDAAVEAGIPYIVSLGALDMANFGARATVPEVYKDRNIVEHNRIVTLVRSSSDDCRKIGDFIAAKLKKAANPETVELWIPKGGVSMLSVPEQPFSDEEADNALFSTLMDGLHGSGVKIVEDERHINDEEFAHDIAEALVRKIGLERLK